MAGDGITSSIDAVNDLVPFTIIGGKNRPGASYHGCVNLYGTFNGATIHWLVSTDDGTTKVPMRNLVGTAHTSTDDDTFCFTWGWSPVSTADQTIFYTSVSGALSPPSLTVDLFDNR